MECSLASDAAVGLFGALVGTQFGGVPPSGLVVNSTGRPVVHTVSSAPLVGPAPSPTQGPASAGHSSIFAAVGVGAAVALVVVGTVVVLVVVKRRRSQLSVVKHAAGRGASKVMLTHSLCLVHPWSRPPFFWLRSALCFVFAVSCVTHVFASCCGFGGSCLVQGL